MESLVFDFVREEQTEERVAQRNFEIVSSKLLALQENIRNREISLMKKQKQKQELEAELKLMNSTEINSLKTQLKMEIESKKTFEGLKKATENSLNTLRSKCKEAETMKKEQLRILTSVVSEAEKEKVQSQQVFSSSETNLGEIRVHKEINEGMCMNIKKLEKQGEEQKKQVLELQRNIQQVNHELEGQARDSKEEEEKHNAFKKALDQKKKELHRLKLSLSRYYYDKDSPPCRADGWTRFQEKTLNKVNNDLGKINSRFSDTELETIRQKEIDSLSSKDTWSTLSPNALLVTLNEKLEHLKKKNEDEEQRLSQRAEEAKKKSEVVHKQMEAVKANVELVSKELRDLEKDYKH